MEDPQHAYEFGLPPLVDNVLSDPTRPNFSRKEFLSLTKIGKSGQLSQRGLQLLRVDIALAHSPRGAGKTKNAPHISLGFFGEVEFREGHRRLLEVLADPPLSLPESSGPWNQWSRE